MKSYVVLAGLVVGWGGVALGADAWAHPEAMTVVMVDDAFQPDHLTFVAGRAYAMRLENHGKDLHEFTAPLFLAAATLRDRRVLSSSGDIVVQPGTSVTVDFIAPAAAGRYGLTCADHDWDGMVGTIDVK